MTPKTRVRAPAPVESLLADVADLRERLRRVETGQAVSQLPNSSIDNTTLPVKDANGVTRIEHGKQADGLYGVTHHNGPPPPKPSAPEVVGQQLKIRVRWDGQFPGGQRPSDLQRIDIHVSETPGFEPTDVTLTDSLFGPGVRSIAVDADPQYVRLVAVSLSEAYSEPSDEVMADSLPVNQLEAEAVKAEHLEAVLAVINRIVSGDPDGAHCEQSENGWFAVRDDGSVSFYVDAASGACMISGEYRTADTGERLVTNMADAGDPTIRGYPESGEDYAEIRSVTVGSRGAWAISGADVLASGPTVTLVADHREATTGGVHATRLAHFDGAGNIIPRATLEHILNPNNDGVLGVAVLDAGLVWGNGRLYVTDFLGRPDQRRDFEARDGDFTGNLESNTMGTNTLGVGTVNSGALNAGGVHLDDAGISAPGRGITTDPNGAMYSFLFRGGIFRGVYEYDPSDEAAKEHFTEVREADIDALLSARVSEWQYRPEHKSFGQRRRVGLTVQEAPVIARTRYEGADGEESYGLDVGTLDGLHLAATQRLHARLSSLQSRVLALEGGL